MSMLNPGGAVTDLVRLLGAVVARIRIGDPMLMYGWRLKFGLVPGCGSYSVGGAGCSPLDVVFAHCSVGYSASYFGGLSTVDIWGYSCLAGLGSGCISAVCWNMV